MAGREILDGYAADAPELIGRFEALSSADVLAAVADLLPARPARILDVGAGTGRDAAWLAGQGHRVVAVEPVARLRRAGQALHAGQGIAWVDDRLPALARTVRRSEAYDLILLVGVWQHLPPDEHSGAIAGLAAMLAPGARMILSMRHGPGSPSRPCFPADPQTVVEAGEAAGLSLVAWRSAASIQQENRDAGVTWTWLCFESRGKAPGNGRTLA